MGCLLALFALICPRFVLALLYLFSNCLTDAFTLGWEDHRLFCCRTPRCCPTRWCTNRAPWGAAWVIVKLGVLLDLSSLDMGRREGRRRRPGRRRSPRSLPGQA